MNFLPLAALALATTSVVARGQETLRLDVTRASTPAEPVVEIRIWAAFDPADYAFASTNFAIEATSGVFQNTQCIPFPRHTCPDPGPVHRGSVVLGAAAGQLHWPGGGVLADTSNPVAIVETEWRPDDVGTEDVEVITRTISFIVYTAASGASEQKAGAVSFNEGAVVIRVRRCYADCDGTDEIDLFDFLCFQDAFATDDFYADCDASGQLDFFDFLCFQNEFVAGCR